MKTYILLLITLLLGGALLCSPSEAAISTPTIYCCTGTSVGCSGNTSASSSVACSSGSHCPTAGSMLVVKAYGYAVASGSTTIADTSSLTWATATSIGTTSGYSHYIFYAQVPSGSCPTITVTFGSSAAFHDIIASWVTGQSTTSPLDAAASLTFTTNVNPQNSSTITTTATTDLIESSISCNTGTLGNFAAGSGYTFLYGSTQTSYITEYKLSSSGGSDNSAFLNQFLSCTFSGGTYGVVSVAAFKVAGTTSTSRHQLLDSRLIVAKRREGEA